MGFTALFFFCQFLFPQCITGPCAETLCEVIFLHYCPVSMYIFSLIAFFLVVSSLIISDQNVRLFSNSDSQGSVKLARKSGFFFFLLCHGVVCFQFVSLLLILREILAFNTAFILCLPLLSSACFKWNLLFYLIRI